ncbi:MAG: hypothetical protein SV253_09510, partial [Halobacteria archaeon]|nr:hypothetical protein [Halobacteria archaeon]
ETDPATATETEDVDEARVLEAFETAVEFYHDHLDDELPDEVDVGADTPPDTPREYFVDERGWDPETLDDKRLGYAPAGHGYDLLDRLMSEGFTRDEILGTGLFYEGLTPHFEGRVVFPYFDDDGEPCYAISRSVGHPDDPKADQKYTKAVKTTDYSHVDEPIYGLETLGEEVETVLVAEGIADAITAHERGYAAVSPVTTQFKRKHHDVVLEAVENADRVVVIADNDPVDSDLGEDEERLEVTQYGEGVKGALRTADFLVENDVDARVALPPTVAHHGNDLDEYLNSGWGTLDQLVAAAKPPEAFDAYDEVKETQEDRVEKARETLEKIGGDTSSIYDLRLTDVLGVREGYRGKNPLGHRGSRENYFVAVDDTVAYDHKRKKAYNPLTSLLVEAGVRDVDAPDGSLDDAEVFEAWRYAKEHGLVAEDDRIPRRALRHVARDTTDWDGELVEHETRDGETFEGLPSGVYNAALDHVEEDLGLDPGRSTTGGSARGHLTSGLPLEQLDALSPNERRRYAEKRDLDYPTTPEVRDRLEDEIKTAMRRGDDVVIDAPTSAGKSYTAATQPWKGMRDVTG